MTDDAMDYIYQATLLAYQVQWDRLGRLDSKVNNTIVTSSTAATLFLGLGGLTLQYVQKSAPLYPYLLLAMICGLILFTVSVALSISAYKLREYRYDPNPVKLVEKYSASERSAILKVLTNHIAVSADYNKTVNDLKTEILRWAIFSLFGGVLVILLFTFGWLLSTIN
jgi:hypothetical protein